MTDQQPLVSIIIPTFNREKWLSEILASLVQQSFPREQFEVIIVNDGSTDGTEEVAQKSYPFRVRYFFQNNQGDAASRNLGAKQSQAEFLVFLDDDMIPEKDFLSLLLSEHEHYPNRIVVGNDHLWLDEMNPLDKRITPPAPIGHSTYEYIPFVDVCSNNMSIRREAYLSVGLMDNLGFPGSSIWCDVDFSYRAYQKGFEFIRSKRAFCWHRDYVAKSFQNRKERMYEVAYRAVVLFQKYPELVYCIPMFSDKTPVDWKHDSFGTIARKLVRYSISSKPASLLIEKMSLMARNIPALTWLGRTLGRLAIGGYIFRGYREGLRDFGPVPVPPKPTVVRSVEKNF